MKNQMNQKSRPLAGRNNGRISKTTPSDSQASAAWAEQGHAVPKSNVTIPDDYAVNNAKEWVDNGSRL